MSPVDQKVIESLARLYEVVQECPDGPEAGRAEAIALWGREEIRTGVKSPFDIAAVLDAVTTGLMEQR